MEENKKKIKKTLNYRQQIDNYQRGGGWEIGK